MPGRRRIFYRKNRDKYSVEQTNVITPAISDWTIVPAANETQQNSSQFAVDIVPPVEFQGKRKIKHITISFGSNEILLTDQSSPPFFYAIVYIPQGYESVPLAVPAMGNAINNYSANQFVMSSGVIEFTGGPLRIRSRLSRNLNSGDRIGLILASEVGTSTAKIFIQMSYAMTLQ